MGYRIECHESEVRSELPMSYRYVVGYSLFNPSFKTLRRTMNRDIVVCGGGESS
jgi:hypothetical protein